MAYTGWIKLYRQLLDSTIWNADEPYDKRSAWVDLLLRANHEDKEVVYNGQPILIQRGQLFTSIRHLAERWGWSYGKVRRYLLLLKQIGMVYQDGTSSGTLLTVANYSNYQDVWITDEHTDDTADESQAVHRADHRRYTTKEDKNIKNDKKIRNKGAGAPVMSVWGVEAE